MNSTNNQNASGSAMTMAQYIASELRKSGTKAWAGLPSPEEMEQLRAERAEHDFQQLKRRADARDRRLEEMKQALKQNSEGAIPMNDNSTNSARLIYAIEILLAQLDATISAEMNEGDTRSDFLKKRISGFKDQTARLKKILSQHQSAEWRKRSLTKQNRQNTKRH